MKNADNLNDDLEGTFEKFEKKFYSMETELTSFVNHSVYKDMTKAITKIKYDIEYGNMYNFKIDVERLIKILEEIIDNEKPKINNIF